MSQHKLIGKGQFTKVYLFNPKQVILRSTDPVKEAMAIGLFPNSKLFPKIKLFDSMEFNDFDYISTYDPDLKERSVLPKLNDYYKNMYRELQKIYFVYSRSDFFEQLNELKGIKKYHLDAIKYAFNSLISYAKEHQIKFEISPRNVSTRNGRLILNDCFFITTAQSI